MRNATATAVGLTTIVGLGAVSPGPTFSSMLTKFGLASICGYQTVRTSVQCSIAMRERERETDALATLALPVCIPLFLLKNYLILSYSCSIREIEG